MPDAATDPVVVLVNGLPGAGKTTLARALSRGTLLPLLSKDAIKEAHADVFGAQPTNDWQQRRWNAAFGAAASETMWSLLADAPGGAILESFWSADVHHLAAKGLRRAGCGRPLEIWCDVPLDLARQRFETRYPRHPIHGALPGDEEWEHWREVARPIELGPVLRVDTARPVSIEPVIAWIARQTREPARRESAPGVDVRDEHADLGPAAQPVRGLRPEPRELREAAVDAAHRVDLEHP
ncbi:MAG TPA: AAA family ATPase [Actinocrinis sp.]|nr:AAA family ATPase [Actinocrinis sp.]